MDEQIMKAAGYLIRTLRSQRDELRGLLEDALEIIVDGDVCGMAVSKNDPLLKARLRTLDSKLGNYIGLPGYSNGNQNGGRK